MLKLSKSRKKNSHTKLANSRSKAPKNRLKVEHIKLPSKGHNHNSSTLSLLPNPYHNSSQCNLLTNSKLKEGKKTGVSMNRNRQSSKSLIVKTKNKKVDKKSKNKQTHNQNHNKSTNPEIKLKPASNVVNKSKTNIIKPAHKLNVFGSVKAAPGKPVSKKAFQQLYERVNIGLYNSKTNSEINFSNASSMRDRQNEPNHSNCHVSGHNRKKALTIDCSDEFILNQYFTNSRIKQPEQQLRNQAAIKIQKVFRGYLTRKKLQQYIESEQAKLKQLSRMLRHGEQYSMSRNVQTPHQLLRDENMGSSSSEVSFQNEEVDFDEEFDISMKKLDPYFANKVDDRGYLDEESSIRHENYDSLNKYISIEDSGLPMSDRRQEEAEEREDYYEEEMQFVDEIQDLEENDNYPSQTDEEQQFNEINNEQKRKQKNDFEGSIGVITNKEDKPADQQVKVTPISSCKKEQPMPTDFSDKKINQFQSYSQDISQRYSATTNKKQTKRSKIQEKDDQSEPQASVNKYKNLQKYQGSHEKEKELIGLLKKQEKQKWATIIAMLHQQITASKIQDEDMSKIMNDILAFSQKNKEQLETSSLNIKKIIDHFPHKSKGTKDVNNQKESQNSFNASESSVLEKSSKIKKKINLSIDIEGLRKIPLNYEKEEEAQKCQRSKKNENMPLIRKKNVTPNFSCITILEKTQQMKKFYQKNLSSYPVEEMIEIRQKALQKREKQMLNKLNEELQSSKVSHDQFLSRLASMQERFGQEKELINKAKMDIFLGNRAAHKLVQDSFLDARYLGFKVPFSQSYREFKGNGDIWIKQIIVDELKQFSKSGKKMPEIEDQSMNLDESCRLEEQRKSQNTENKFLNSKSVLNNSSLEQQSRSISFSQNSLMEQDISYHQYDLENQNLDIRPTFAFDESFEDSDQEIDDNFHNIDAKKLKKVQLQSKKLVFPLNTRIDSEELQPNIYRQARSYQERVRASLSDFQQKQGFRKNDMTPRSHCDFSVNVKPQSEVYKIPCDDDQKSSSSQSLLFNQDSGIPINEMTCEQVDKLIWEAAGQLFENSHLRISLSKSKTRVPSKISYDEGLRFIDFINRQIPGFQVLRKKINQKMAPTRLQLLKFMRVIIDDEEQEEQGLSHSSQEINDLQEIGKYQLILPPQILLNALGQFLAYEAQSSSRFVKTDPQVQEAKIRSLFGDKVSGQCIKKIVSREKVAEYNCLQMEDLRLEIKKIEMHCIFDAYNETLMKKRMKTAGYSGIGLNQLTILFSRETINEITREDEFIRLLKDSEQDIRELVGPEKSSTQKLLQQNYEELCGNDSVWVNYSDEALSFAMEFVFMLEDEIWCMEAAEIGHLLGLKIEKTQY